MQNHPSKHQPPITEKNHTHGVTNAHNTTKRKPLATLLIESDYRPLVFLGRCVQYFGLGAVAGFFLGAVCVYGYAAFRPLPYIGQSLSGQPRESPTPTPTQPPGQTKTVWLHGVVKSNDKPVKDEFEIGVLATRQGPFQDGSFSIQVPESDRYLVTLWNVGYQRFKLVELRADSDGNVHDVLFPSDMTRLEGPRSNQKSAPANGYATAAERPFRAKPIAALLDKGTGFGLTGSTRSGFARLPRLDKRSQL